MAMTDFKAACDRYRENGRPLKPERFTMKIEDARTLLAQGLQYFTGLQQPQWLPEYEKVAEYLSDTKGKGLLLYGNCGTGKTLITQRIIPAIISMKYDRIVSLYKAIEMFDKMNEIKRNYFVAIDDLGTENAVQHKFKDVFCPFAEIIDNAEDNGRFLLVSTNINIGRCRCDSSGRPILNDNGERDYSDNVIVRNYGQRAFDRLKSVFCCIPFNAPSMRN